jgi:hypothetical protein
MHLQPNTLGSRSTNHAPVQPKSWQYQRHPRKLGFHHLQQPHSESNLAFTTRLHPLAAMEGTKQTHFHSKHSPAEATWNSVVNLVRETIQSKNWQPRDTDCNREEAHIFQSWTLRLKDSGTSRPPKSHFSSPSLWTPPPPGFIKINFDGASKGNPGPAGYGAVIRNSTGEILTLTAGYLGETTNNVAELTGLLQGLQQALALGNHNIILEGDSQIVIQLITKILHGGHPHKISPSWRLAGLLEDFHFYSKITSVSSPHTSKGRQTP